MFVDYSMREHAWLENDFAHMWVMVHKYNELVQ